MAVVSPLPTDNTSPSRTMLKVGKFATASLKADTRHRPAELGDAADCSGGSGAGKRYSSGPTRVGEYFGLQREPLKQRRER